MTKELSAEGDPEKRIEDAMLKKIWQKVFWNKLGENAPMFTICMGGEKITVQSKDLQLESRDENIFNFSVSAKSLAANLTQLCNSVAEKLVKGNTVQELYHEVGNVKKAHEELREMLNPVKLRPLLIRTRCDLCPM